MGAGMAVLRSKDPEGVAQEMWALFAVYQAIHTLIGAAVDATGIPPEKISFPHALLLRPPRSRRAFPPQDRDLALAAFLLKILDPGFFVRDRPDRSSPPATKKAGDFPARKDQPSVVRVTRRLQIHCLDPRIGPALPWACNPPLLPTADISTGSRQSPRRCGIQFTVNVDQPVGQSPGVT